MVKADIGNQSRVHLLQISKLIEVQPVQPVQTLHTANKLQRTCLREATASFACAGGNAHQTLCQWLLDLQLLSPLPYVCPAPQQQVQGLPFEDVCDL